LLLAKWVGIDGPYNKDSTVKTLGLRRVYDKFHAYF
jgi:ribosomal protein L30/L7E